MPVILKETSVGASATVDNLISGSVYEFARSAQIVSIGLSQSVTGLVANISSGADVVAEEFPVPILTRYPIIPDEMYFSDVMAPGDRLVIRIRNTTAGAITARGIVQVSGVG
jgi:hypothetical protein